MPLSSESSSCRIDWRPSRLLCSALVGLGALAATSILLSALPPLAGMPMALLAAGHGLWLARREARRRAFSLHWTPDGDGLVLIFADRSQRLSGPHILVRGPLACVSGRGEDGRTRRVFWWPDTLPARSSRALRLASGKRIGESGPALATMSG